MQEGSQNSETLFDSQEPYLNNETRGSINSNPEATVYQGGEFDLQDISFSLQISHHSDPQDSQSITKFMPPPQQQQPLNLPPIPDAFTLHQTSTVHSEEENAEKLNDANNGNNANNAIQNIQNVTEKNVENILNTQYSIQEGDQKERLDEDNQVHKIYSQKEKISKLLQNPANEEFKMDPKEQQQYQQILNNFNNPLGNDPQYQEYKNNVMLHQQHEKYQLFEQLYSHGCLSRSDSNRSSSLKVADGNCDKGSSSPSSQETTFSFEDINVQTLPSMKQIQAKIGDYIKMLKKKTNIDLKKLIILESIGQGAFAKVYRVFDPIHNRFYALKKIQKENFRTKDKFLKICNQEIQNLLYIANIRNKNLLEVQWIELDEEEQSCQILLELGKGTLQEFSQFRKQQGIKWAEEEIWTVLMQLIKQLECLKNSGIYHRDIKPANIIFSELQGKFKLTDFGCSTHEDLSEKKDQQLLEKLQLHQITDFFEPTPKKKKFNVCGTPFYMSPELKHIYEVQRLYYAEYDPFACDLYSIGITIIKMVEPSLRPESLKAYFKGPFKQNYKEMYSVIQGLVSEEVEARKITSRSVIASYERIQKLKKISNGQLESVKYLYCSTLASDKFTKKFVLDKTEETQYNKFLFKTIFSKNKDLDPDVYIRMFMYEDAASLLQQQIQVEQMEIRKQQLQQKNESYPESPQNPLNLKLIQLKLALARCYFYSEKYNDQFHILQDILKIQNFSDSHHNQQSKLLLASIQKLLGNFYHQHGEIEKAVEAFKEALVIRQKYLQENSPEIAEIYSNLGLCYMIQGQSIQALQMFERHLEINSISNEGDIEDSILTPTLFMGYPIEHQKLKEYLHNFEKIEKKFKNDTDQVTLFFYKGLILLALKNYPGANSSFNKCIEIMKEFYGEESPQIAKLYLSLAFYCKFRVETIEQAESHLLNSLKICQKWFGDNNINTGYVYLSLGQHYYNLDMLNDAAENIEKGLQILDEKSNSHQKKMKGLCLMLYRLYYRLNNKEKVQCYINLLHSMCTNQSSQFSQIYSDCIFNLSKSLIHQHKDHCDHLETYLHLNTAESLTFTDKNAEMIQLKSYILIQKGVSKEISGDFHQAIQEYLLAYEFLISYNQITEALQCMSRLAYLMIKIEKYQDVLDNVNSSLHRVSLNLSQHNGFLTLLQMFKSMASYCLTNDITQVALLNTHLAIIKQNYSEDHEYYQLCDNMLNEKFFKIQEEKAKQKILSKQGSQ